MQAASALAAAFLAAGFFAAALRRRRAALGRGSWPPLPAYLAMNSSVSSRAWSSGRWFCGDFIR